MVLVSIVLHLICLDFTKILMNKHSLRELKVLGLIRNGFVDMHFSEITDQNERFVQFYLISYEHIKSGIISLLSTDINQEKKRIT